MTNNKTITTCVYDYLDYRKFLHDITKEFKRKRPHFNHSNIAKWAGLKSPGYIKMIVDGKRNLTAEMMEKFCEILEITGKEKRYFQALVAYNQEDNPDRKKHFFEEVASLTPRSAHYELKKTQYRYLSKPYYSCVRELVTLKDFKEDYDWIARRCLPSINDSEAKDAIETLLEIGMLKRDDSGKLLQTESFVKTEDYDTQCVEAYHAHDEMLKLAREALINVPQKERNYYALTMSLSHAQYKEIIEKFYKFRDEVVGVINQSQAGENDEVYQINFHIFPRTKKQENEK